jgi:UDP-N-acetyl-D-mannosaminuronic acid dehydrogenase
LLAYGVKDKNVPLRLIPASRAVNDSMPAHMADLLEAALSKAGRNLKGARIAVLGYAYLEDSDDTRNSPSESLARSLRDRGAEPVIHDPWIHEYSGDVYGRVKGCDAVVVMVAHSEYKKLDLDALKLNLKIPILVDGRRVFEAGKTRSAGFEYKSVGAALS